jgi:heterodisulfide reductase subunit A
MRDWIIEQARQALEEGYDGVLGLRQRWGNVGPYLFTGSVELDHLELEPKYNLTPIARALLQKSPDRRIAMVARGCDVRAVKKLARIDEFDEDRVYMIGVACSMEQAEECNCEKPIYDVFKCTGCWRCIDICPVDAIEKINPCPIVVPGEYNEGLSWRKATYVPFAQAVPLKAARDSDHCLTIRGDMQCLGCERTCLAEAVVHGQEPVERDVEVGAVIVSAGFDAFQPKNHEVYAFSRYPDVVTAMEFERLLSASGPTMGHLARPSDHREAQRIAWLQCVGSRDMNHCDHEYCSGVCCMYAIKEAVIAKEHSKTDLDTAIFYMDMRTHGKDFERYYDRAREEHGVRFIRSRVQSVEPSVDGDRDLTIRYVTDAGDVEQERFDMVVLSVGLETPDSVKELAKRLDVKLNNNGFAESGSFAPVATSREGVFVCGAFQSPKDIPQSVVEAGAAAAAAGGLLAPARGTMQKEKEVPPARNVYGEPPRVGVFVCNCGINISGVVDVPAVRDYASTLPNVVHTTDNLYTCSQDAQELIKEAIEEHRLNRVVVAACTPRTHEPLFQETLEDAGLNKYLFEMANIRNQDSWVHPDDPQGATDKAKDLVRMAVSKVTLLEPLSEAELSVTRRALVVGGGIAGMVAARTLADQGFPVDLVERSGRFGGQALNLHRTWRGEDVPAYVEQLAAGVQNHPQINSWLETELQSVEGFVGNFKTTLGTPSGEQVVEHGVTMIATGAREYKPAEYGYGDDPRILTHQDMDRLFAEDDSRLNRAETAVFIQCVGSREPDRPYCSRVCCTHSIQSALELKRRNPDCDVFILVRDVRSYGERESLYRQAREAGVIFVRFDLENKPVVETEGGELRVTFRDHILGRTMQVKPDLLTLATAIVPPENERLAQFFKVPLSEDGFFIEAHAKLRPVEFATDGVFLCGLAHYPKPIDETVAQAQAAASRAVTLLSSDTVRFSGNVAMVNPALCSSCGVCVEICPYSAPGFNDKGVSEINPALCKGCGLCVASCRSGAIRLRGFDDQQIFAMIESV